MRPPSVPSDTDPEVFDLLVERWRSMTVAERVDLIDQINADVELMTIAGIRAQHPGLTETKLRFELTRRRYGDSLANDAFQDIIG